MPQKDVTMFEICPKISVESMIRNEMFFVRIQINVSKYSGWRASTYFKGVGSQLTNEKSRELNSELPRSYWSFDQNWTSPVLKLFERYKS